MAQSLAQAQSAGASFKSEEDIDYEKLSPVELASLIKSLPQTETDPEVLAYEKKVLNSDFKNWRKLKNEQQICLALSLYYLGWGKDVFDRLEYGIAFYAPTNAQMREKNIADAKEYSANKDNDFRKNIVVFQNSEEPSIYLENPSYSEASAREYFCKNFEKYRGRPRDAFFFALDMLRSGASPQDIECALQDLQNKFPYSAKTCAAAKNAISLHRLTRESFIRKYLDD